MKGRGGSAGGGKGGPQLQYIKKVPKFLQQFQMRANAQDDKQITEQMLSLERKSKQEEMEDRLKEQGFDIENAQVEYMNDDVMEKKDEIIKKQKQKVQQQEETSTIGKVEKVDMKTFKPVFKKKNEAGEGDKTKDKQLQDKKQADSGKRKNKLDDYIKDFDKEEKKATQKKKIKSNLISFGDDEDEEEDQY